MTSGFYRGTSAEGKSTQILIYSYNDRHDSSDVRSYLKRSLWNVIQIRHMNRNRQMKHSRKKATRKPILMHEYLDSMWRKNKISGELAATSVIPQILGLYRQWVHKPRITQRTLRMFWEAQDLTVRTDFTLRTSYRPSLVRPRSKTNALAPFTVSSVE